MDYAERDAALYFWQFGQKHFKWTNWDTYTDRQLICYNENEMVTLQLPLTIEVLGTPLNVRDEPSTTAKIVATINEITKFETKIVSAGTVVNGNSTWYQIVFNGVKGWVSGAFMKELAEDCSECQAQVVKLTAENQVLKTELDSYKPVTYYIKE